MTLGERCDEIVRLIEETLGDVSTIAGAALASTSAEDPGPSLPSASVQGRSRLADSADAAAPSLATS